MPIPLDDATDHSETHAKLEIEYDSDGDEMPDLIPNL
jgi:hypothetical protein